MQIIIRGINMTMLNILPLGHIYSPFFLVVLYNSLALWLLVRFSQNGTLEMVMRKETDVGGVVSPAPSSAELWWPAVSSTKVLSPSCPVALLTQLSLTLVLVIKELSYCMMSYDCPEFQPSFVNCPLIRFFFIYSNFEHAICFLLRIIKIEN